MGGVRPESRQISVGFGKEASSEGLPRKGRIGLVDGVGSTFKQGAVDRCRPVSNIQTGKPERAVKNVKQWHAPVLTRTARMRTRG